MVKTLNSDKKKQQNWNKKRFKQVKWNSLVPIDFADTIFLFFNNEKKNIFVSAFGCYVRGSVKQKWHHWSIFSLPITWWPEYTECIDR